MTGRLGCITDLVDHLLVGRSVDEARVNAKRVRRACDRPAGQPSPIALPLGRAVLLASVVAVGPAQSVEQRS